MNHVAFAPAVMRYAVHLAMEKWRWIKVYPGQWAFGCASGDYSGPRVEDLKILQHTLLDLEQEVAKVRSRRKPETSLSKMNIVHIIKHLIVHDRDPPPAKRWQSHRHLLACREASNCAEATTRRAARSVVALGVASFLLSETVFSPIRGNCQKHA